MIITSIHIYGFGKYQDFTADFGKGLNLIEGSNEAGKSTLLAFVRAMLFGFESRRTPELRYEPLEGGKFGGAMTLLDSTGQEYRVERIGHRKSQGIVRVILPNGEEKGEEWLGKLLGGISPTLYANIYSFGLTELSLMNSLNQEDVAHFLYNSGTGVSLQQWERTWVEEGEKLFKPRGSQPVINQLLSQIDDIEKQIKQYQAENESYNLLHQELDVLNQEMEFLEAKILNLKMESKRWDKLSQIYPLWLDIRAKQARLNQLPELRFFPEQGVLRLDQLEKDIVNAEVEAEEERIQCRQLDMRISHCKMDPKLLQLQEEIQLLFAQSTRWEEKNEHLVALRAECEELSKSIDYALSQLGRDWNPDKLRNLDTSLARKEMLREQRQAFQEISSEQKTLAHLKKEKEEEAAELKRQQEQMGERPSSANTASQIERLEQDFHKYQELYHTLQNDLSRKEWITREWAGKSQENPKRLKAAAILFFFLGLVLSAGCFIWLSDSSWSGFPALAGLLLSIIYWVRATMEQSSRKAPNLKKQLEEINGQIQGKQSQLTELCSRAFAGEKSMNAISRYIQQVRRNYQDELRFIEKKRLIEERQRQHFIELEKLERKLEGVSSRFHRELERWNETLSELGFPAGLSPEGALEVINLSEKVRDKLQKYEDMLSKCSALETELDEFSDRVDQLCLRAEFSVKSEQPWTKLLLLHRILEENLKAGNERELLLRKKEEREEEFAKKVRLIEKWKQEKAHLLTQADAANSEHFRQLAGVFEERQKRKEELLVLSEALDAAASKEMIEALSRYSLEEVEIERDRIAEELERVQAELQTCLDRRGQWKNKLSRLESGEGLSALHQQRQELLIALEQASKRWTVYRLAHLLLKRTRESYERERQPSVLRLASSYFQRMTKDRYVRIFSPVGEQKIYVERSDGRRLEPGYLSRGTREQLFLSLRFALIEESSGPERVPIILDDIFVNFDRVRTLQALDSLLEVSRHQQVFFFTCHSHVANQMKEQIPHLNYLNLEQNVTV
ncbi:AAA family ATPase [Ammoniphilus sp. 3BR4]